MAARAGMTDIIALVERLINDESNAHHSDDEIQDALDQYRIEANYWQLDPVRSIAEGGTVTYLTFTAPRGYTHWESDGTLVDYNYAELAPASSDWFTGRWTFGSEPTQPVRILGFSHDVYAAAADLLDTRASMLSEDLQSFSGQNGAFTYAAKSPSLRNQAKAYRAKARVMVNDLYRTDVGIF